jgi:hypothetical protein
LFVSQISQFFQSFLDEASNSLRQKVVLVGELAQQRLYVWNAITNQDRSHLWSAWSAFAIVNAVVGIPLPLKPGQCVFVLAFVCTQLEPNDPLLTRKPDNEVHLVIDEPDAPRFPVDLPRWDDLVQHFILWLTLSITRHRDSK